MTERILALDLPYPPTANLIWRSRAVISRGKRAWVQHYLAPKGKEYRDAVRLAVLRQCGGWLFVERVSVNIEVTMPDRRARDIDNLCKATLDALTHAGL